MNRTQNTIEVIKDFFSNRTTGNIPEMKSYVEEHIGETINLNTFYNIVHKMKMSGYIDCTDIRGEYHWIKDSDTRSTGTGHAEDTVFEAPVKPLPVISQERLSKRSEKETVSAEEFVRRAVAGLRIKTKYNTFLKDSMNIDPWSISPEYAQCIASIKKVVEEFKKIDEILEREI